MRTKKDVYPPDQPEQWQKAIQQATLFPGVIGRSPVMRELADTVVKVARSSQPVLIYGQTGSGKEAVARAIHTHSRRAQQLFVEANCAGFNGSLLDSELFGHVKGAFTGADRDKSGLFESARGGSLFLDEIGDMPLVVQAKLLRALESKTYRRLGDHTSRPIDVRLIAASHANLVEKMADRSFRPDLFFRLYVLGLTIPCLEDRPEDIPLLTWHFARQAAKEEYKTIHFIDPALLDELRGWTWSGQVRQLKHLVTRMVVYTETGRLTLDDVPPPVYNTQFKSGEHSEKSDGFYVDQMIPLKDVEKQYIGWVLERAGGNAAEAAQLLGFSHRSVLSKKLKRLDIKH